MFSSLFINVVSDVQGDFIRDRLGEVFSKRLGLDFTKTFGRPHTTAAVSVPSVSGPRVPSSHSRCDSRTGAGS